VQQLADARLKVAQQPGGDELEGDLRVRVVDDELARRRRLATLGKLVSA
jgi:hypothetical protein